MQKSALQAEADRATTDDVMIMVDMAEQAERLIVHLHELVRSSPELRMHTQPLVEARALLFLFGFKLTLASYRVK